MSVTKTIAEVRAANAQLQNEIRRLIRQFESETGVVVNAVELIHGSMASGERETVAVRLETLL